MFSTVPSVCTCTCPSLRSRGGSNSTNHRSRIPHSSGALRFHVARASIFGSPANHNCQITTLPIWFGFSAARTNYKYSDWSPALTATLAKAVTGPVLDPLLWVSVVFDLILISASTLCLGYCFRNITRRRGIFQLKMMYRVFV